MKKFLSQEMHVAAKMHHAVSLMQKHADGFLQQELGLSFMQALILNIIKHHPQTNQAFIVGCTRFTPGAVSRQIEVLHEKGLVSRTTKHDNRRAQKIELTQEGVALVERSFSMLDTELRQYFSSLTQNELGQLGELMTKVILQMDPQYYQFREAEDMQTQ